MDPGNCKPNICSGWNYCDDCQGGLIGPLVNKFGELKLTVIGTGFVMTGCLFLIAANKENSIPSVFTAVAILACGTGLVTPCLRALISKKLNSSSQGVILGSLQGLQSFGTFIGAAGAGIAYDVIGAKSPFYITSIMLFGAMILISGNFQFLKNHTQNEQN